MATGGGFCFRLGGGLGEYAMSEEPSQKTGRLYDHRWQILIYKPAYTENEDGTKDRDPEHDIAMDVSRLRCVFKAQYSVDTAIGLCTLTVYNMNAATEKEIIEEGFQIALYGGYQEGQYGEIFVGDIVQIFSQSRGWRRLPAGNYRSQGRDNTLSKLRQGLSGCQQSAPGRTQKFGGQFRHEIQGGGDE